MVTVPVVIGKLEFMTDTYRLPPDVQLPNSGSDAITVMTEEDNTPFDPAIGSQITTDDGSVTISFELPTPERSGAEDFNENLAEFLTDATLSGISERLLMGIEQDKQSREAWLQNMSSGISLLGLEVKEPVGASVAGSSPSEGISSIDSPLLLEAVLRFQANAYGELLPADGPVKTRNDGEKTQLSEKLAQALEKDLNHYLTKTAKEYYPDSDRMLLMLGFSGISFKKGYHDPIKRRPVIASIDAKDLIVSNAATDIEGAGRVTHRIMMRPSTLKRMQLLGAYRQVYLGQAAITPQLNPVDEKINQIQGIAAPVYVDTVNDQERELYECYCELDIPGFEHEMDGEPTGLPLPYKVTIDVESRQILEIRRNWHEDDEFCLPRNRIIAYMFVPGLGFYGIGLLNILGNATKAVTAAWRLLIDAGMFANFPGFLYVKQLAKQLTNQFRIAPGSGQGIDTAGGDIRASVMPLPYKDPSAVFIQLIDSIATAAQRVGGTAELQIGEGKQDAPVGTTLALIEQATKLMNAVHKRLHQAQGQEFDMLRSLLMEDPEALWRHNRKSNVLKVLTEEAGLLPIAQQQEEAAERQKKLFLAALNDLSIVPAADPNTSSQTERYMKVVALRQMAGTNPSISMDAVDKRAMQIMGIEDGDSFFKPPVDPNTQPPNPEQLIAQSTVMAAQARMLDAQTKAQTTQAQLALKYQEAQSREKVAQLGVARELVVHSDNMGLKNQEMQLAATNKKADRLHDLVKSQMGQSAQQKQAFGLAELRGAFDLERSRNQHVQGVVAKSLDHQNALRSRGLEFQHSSQSAREARAHEAQQRELERANRADENRSRTLERAQQQAAKAIQTKFPKGSKTTKKD